MPTRRTLLLAASVLSALSACMFGADFDELRASSSDGNDDAGDASGRSPSGDAAPSFVCPSKAALCDLFERADVQGQWTTVHQLSGTTLAIDPVFGIGRGLHVSVTPGSVGGALWFTSQSGPASALRVAVQIAFDEPPPETTVVLSVGLGTGTVQIVGHADGHFEAKGSDGHVDFTTSPSKGLRHRLELDVTAPTMSSSRGGFQVYLGDALGEGRTLVAAGADKQLSGAPTVKLGIADETATAAYDLFYDDVVVVVGSSDFSQGI